MAEQLNIETTVDAWAEIVIKNWLRKITELDIGQSGELFNSFTHQVIGNAGGIPDRIELAHLYYGVFSDMGVGNGVTLEEVRESNRKAKPWRSKQLFAQTARLSELMADKYAMISAAIIKENVEHKVYKTGSSGSGLSEGDLVWMRQQGLLH